ncbi:MAG TPA: DEAD/DEAH box helicase, partial [Desulfuromonadaceae bacterium]
MTFAELNLNPAILKALTACGYSAPTPIQAQAIPLVMAGHDLIATAQTGTGKTAAFVLPALERLAT